MNRNNRDSLIENRSVVTLGQLNNVNKYSNSNIKYNKNSNNIENINNR